MSDVETNPAPSSVAPTRRVVLRSAGLAGGLVGATVLSACGGSSGGSASTSGSAAGSGSASGSAVTVPTSKVAVGGGYIDSDAQVVVTQPASGTYKAFSSICTHQGCPVTQIQDKKIICPCHGSEYSIADGSVLQGPAARPLKAMTATVSGTTITVA